MFCEINYILPLFARLQAGTESCVTRSDCRGWQFTRTGRCLPKLSETPYQSSPSTAIEPFRSNKPSRLRHPATLGCATPCLTLSSSCRHFRGASKGFQRGALTFPCTAEIFRNHNHPRLEDNVKLVRNLCLSVFVRKSLAKPYACCVHRSVYVIKSLNGVLLCSEIWLRHRTGVQG